MPELLVPPTSRSPCRSRSPRSPSRRSPSAGGGWGAWHTPRAAHGKDVRYDLRLPTNEEIQATFAALDLWRYFGAFLSLTLLALNVFALMHDGYVMSHQATTYLPKSMMARTMQLQKVLPSLPVPYVAMGHLVGLFELMALASFSISIFAHAALIAYPDIAKPESHFQRRWESVAVLFLEMLPKLRGFSAMRVLSLCVPTILVKDLQGVLVRARRPGRMARFTGVLRIIWFLATRAFYLIFGFDAFFMKFSLVARSCLRPFLPLSLWGDVHLPPVLHLIIFFHQVNAITPSSVYLQERLFRFVLGGEDGLFTEREFQHLRAWQASFCHRAWEALAHIPTRFLVLLVTFSDMDFQRIAVARLAREGGAL